jgi:hypothetical protein
MKARVFYSADKGILGKYTIHVTRKSDDWHFTADFMTLKGFIAGATMKR